MVETVVASELHKPHHQVAIICPCFRFALLPVGTARRLLGAVALLQDVQGVALCVLDLVTSSVVEAQCLQSTTSRDDLLFLQRRV